MTTARAAIPVLILAAVALTSCAGTTQATPIPTVTVTVTAEPTPAPTVTVTVSPELDAAADREPADRLAALRAISQDVVAVDEPEVGRWIISTAIVDPRGDNGSPEALQAIAVCEEAVRLGAEFVSVMESDDTTFVTYGNQTYGPGCTEI